ncbi:MAG: TRAP transporter TatT component family protein [Proteobacteria bacterium]|nr:TRAP transporter TatT component family protein [Pseudomonadota bacterium]
MNISIKTAFSERLGGDSRTGCHPVLFALLATAGFAACDLGKITVDTTSKVLARAQPALKQEADYDLAARALPGTLKTIEGFWYVNPNRRLTAILAEGFCQYSTGFVEDEWEVATLNKRFDDADYLSARATKMFVRCTNYALRLLGTEWQKGIFADFDTVRTLLKDAQPSQREGLMWASIGLAATINQNKDNMTLVSQLPTAKMMLQKVVQLDDQSDYRADLTKRALPHIALGLAHTSQAKALGGDPDAAKKHFERAMAITQNKLLLVNVFYARHYAVMVQDRALFRKLLLGVLNTPPSIWPDQRLANEIAHRRARRYLKYEREWF